ncbi:hypothetical protein [Lacipirellula parvula]|uniref:Uncharacterized protein n=1 Tax=Lacipirellula parvula TaxID=2650471 RepID=A0A5K7XGB7_9BACT|nr:hypothetical protein [Lacipirellula parvula]BBO35880.1 hypothetical protein PLANPX_5492 [Lacipirellula parvula]
MAERPQLPQSPITAADLERFHRNAPAAMSRRGPAFVGQTFADAFETLLIGGMPIVGMLWLDWSSEQLLLFLLIGAWMAILLDVARYLLMSPAVERFAQTKFDDWHVWVVAGALREGRMHAATEHLRVKHQPGMGIFVDLACGGVGTLFIILAMTIDADQNLFALLADRSVQWCLAGLIGYQLVAFAWEVVRWRRSPQTHEAKVLLGMRGLGLFLMMFLVVMLRESAGESGGVARGAMLAINGAIVALGLFNVVGLLWLRGETRWLRNYLDQRRRA